MKSPKKKYPKVKGRGCLNQKAQIFEDKRTKRNRTRRSQEDTAIKEQID